MTTTLDHVFAQSSAGVPRTTPSLGINCLSVSEAGVAEARALLEQLGVRPGQLVAGAYVDLLNAGPAAVPHATG